MSEDTYRRLAQRLDAIPNGFPATESGIELQLLAKIYTPDEAALAAVMRLTAEPAADIAARAGVNPEAAYGMLKGMSRKGLIRTSRGQGGLTFGLIPFVVGIYEEQLPRLDLEMASLFERYVQETHGLGHVLSAPPIHRVIPVREAIPFQLEIFAYEQASHLLEQARAWGVRDCICRVQQKLLDKGCGRPVDNCLVFAPVEGVFDHGQVTHPLSKAQALQVLRDTEEMGLVHSTGNYRDGNFYICNCCTCCCGVMRGLAEFGVPTAIARSRFRAVVDPDQCAGCDDCLRRCQFKALSLPEDTCVVDQARCVGCGLCTMVCRPRALRLEPRPEGEVLPLPADFQEWMSRRAQERHVAISDIL